MNTNQTNSRAIKPAANVYFTRSGDWVADAETGREIGYADKRKWAEAEARKFGFRPVRRPDLDRSA